MIEIDVNGKQIIVILLVPNNNLWVGFLIKQCGVEMISTYHMTNNCVRKDANYSSDFINLCKNYAKPQISFVYKSAFVAMFQIS